MSSSCSTTRTTITIVTVIIIIIRVPSTNNQHTRTNSHTHTHTHSLQTLQHWLSSVWHSQTEQRVASQSMHKRREKKTHKTKTADRKIEVQVWRIVRRARERAVSTFSRKTTSATTIDLYQANFLFNNKLRSVFTTAALIWSLACLSFFSSLFQISTIAICTSIVQWSLSGKRRWDGKQKKKKSEINKS